MIFEFVKLITHLRHWEERITISRGCFLQIDIDWHLSFTIFSFKLSYQMNELNGSLPRIFVIKVRRTCTIKHFYMKSLLHDSFEPRKWQIQQESYYRSVIHCKKTTSSFVFDIILPSLVCGCKSVHSEFSFEINCEHKLCRRNWTSLIKPSGWNFNERSQFTLAYSVCKCYLVSWVEIVRIAALYLLNN